MVSTHLKNISQNGNLPQIGVKIKNIWNHHLEKSLFWRFLNYFVNNRRIAASWAQCRHDDSNTTKLEFTVQKIQTQPTSPRQNLNVSLMLFDHNSYLLAITYRHLRWATKSPSKPTQPNTPYVKISVETINHHFGESTSQKKSWHFRINKPRHDP